MRGKRSLEVIKLEQQQQQIKEYCFTLAWKQTAKLVWYIDKLSIKADTLTELLRRQDEIIVCMNEGRAKLHNVALLDELEKDKEEDKNGR